MLVKILAPAGCLGYGPANMLRNTFCHIPQVGVKTEAKLWEAGLLTWDDLMKAESLPVGRPSQSWFMDQLEESVRRYEAHDAAWFAKGLPSYQLWRLFPEFRHSVAYLDIETTGIGPPNDHITTISVWDGTRVHTYIHGENLDDFATDIMQYQLLVTFNGSCFDIPFIEKAFGIRLDKAHIDLRFILKAVEVTGGLKKVEKHFGLDRGELDGVDGYYAVLLWKEYQKTGDRRYLDTLLSYNVEDVISLEMLMVQAYNLHLEKLLLDSAPPIPLPQSPVNPVEAFPQCIINVRNKYIFRGRKRRK